MQSFLINSPSRPRTASPLLPLMYRPEAERRGTAFPAVPALLATQLQLEMLLSGCSVDLREAAGIIGNDLGATLEIFRRAGEESGVHTRLVDCLASLGTDVWMETLCANTVERVAPSSGKLGELTAFWEHGRQIAYACWLIAEQSELVCPEEAYLVGLLHEAATLPALLAWSEASCVGDLPVPWSKTAAAQLAFHWQLPEYLQVSLAAPQESPLCKEMLRTAHFWSRGDSCLLDHTA